jgi:hypothetical protein
VSSHDNSPLQGPGFIILKSFNAAEAIDLLLETFPQLVENESRQDLLETGADYAYERLGDRFRKNSTDPKFLERMAAFVNRLEESRDRFLLELLVVSLLENIAQDRRASDLLKTKLSASARTILEEVESRYFGRTDTATS